MALTAPRAVTFEGQPEKASGLLTESDVYYRGAILAADGSTGLLRVPDDSADLEAFGIFTGRLEDGVTDYAKSVGAGENPRAELLVGKVWLPHDSAAQGLVGTLVYVEDDEKLTSESCAKTVAYRALDFKTGYLLVDLRNPLVP